MTLAGPRGYDLAMFDAVPPPTIHQRADGAAHVVLSAASGSTRLVRLAQAGSAKAMLPRIHAGAPEVVFLNTSGGLTGGDRLAFALDLADHAEGVATTQTAERAYRAGTGRAEVRVTLTAGEGARLHWLPQETILYDRAVLDRITRLDLAKGAEAVIAEMIVLGRAAMGETVARLSLTDRREVWSGAHPVWIDRVAMTDAALAARPALLNGARAFATIALIGQGAEDALTPVRTALGDDGHASAWDGKCIVRLAAADALALKRAVARVLGAMRRGAPLPRVWQI
jgi:urease accessory protein